MIRRAASTRKSHGAERSGARARPARTRPESQRSVVEEVGPDEERIGAALTRMSSRTGEAAVSQLGHQVGNTTVHHVLVQAAAVTEADSAVTLSFAPKADESVVSDKSRRVLEAILRAARLHNALITSTARTPQEQARVMYANLESHGVASQKALYGSAGDQVIDVYVELKKKKATPDAIRVAMLAKIEELGPATVSHHVADPSVLNVIDIAPSSITDQSAFIKAVEAEVGKSVARFLQPPNDPAFHIEIEQ